MALIGALNILLGMNAKQVTKASKTVVENLDSIEEHARHASHSLETIKQGLELAGIGVGAHEAVEFLKSSVEAFREAEQQQRKLEAVLEATGHAAGFTADQLRTINSALQSQTNYDDDAIAGGEAVLATFKEIRGVQFQAAIDSMLDLSAVLGQDLQSSALQLGKALNDPVRGITALRRAGVSFTEEQQAQIKAMVAAGDTVGAQQVILAELRAEFGGAAKAMRDSLTGAANAWGDLKEAVGSFVATDAVQGAIAGVTTAVESMTAALNSAGHASEAAVEGLNRLSDTEAQTSSFLRTASKILSLGTTGDLFGAEVKSDDRDLEAFKKKYAELVEAGQVPAVAAPAVEGQGINRAIAAGVRGHADEGEGEAAAPERALDAADKLNAKLREERQLLGLTGEAREIAALQLKGLSDAELAETRALAASVEQERQAAKAGELAAKLREEIALFGLEGQALEIARLKRAGVTEAELAEARALEQTLGKLRQEAQARKEAADAAADFARDASATREDLERQVATFGMSSRQATLYELSLRSVAQAQAAIAAGGQIERLERQRAALQEQAAAAEGLHRQLDQLNGRIAVEGDTPDAAIDRERAQQLAAQADAADRAKEHLAALEAEEKRLRETQAAASRSGADLAAARAADQRLARLEAQKKAIEEQAQAQRDLADEAGRLFEETRTPAEKYQARLEHLAKVREAALAELDAHPPTAPAPAVADRGAAEPPPAVVDQRAVAARRAEIEQTIDRAREQAKQRFGEEGGERRDNRVAAATRGGAEAFHSVVQFQNPKQQVEKQSLAELRAIRKELFAAGKEERKKNHPSPVRRI